MKTDQIEKFFITVWYIADFFQQHEFLVLRNVSTVHKSVKLYKFVGLCQILF